MVSSLEYLRVPSRAHALHTCHSHSFVELTRERYCMHTHLKIIVKFSFVRDHISLQPVSALQGHDVDRR